MTATSIKNVLDFVCDLDALIGIYQHPVDQQLGQLGGQRVRIENHLGRFLAAVLPPSTAQLLRERKKTAPTEWIFPNPFDPEHPIAPGTAYNRLKVLLKEAGLPDIRFHDLRHTFATHAIASGVDAKTLSGILGHTNASFTLDTYTHVTPDMQKAASGIVGGFMEDLLGKGLRPWQRNGKAEPAP